MWRGNPIRVRPGWQTRCRCVTITKKLPERVMAATACRGRGQAENESPSRRPAYCLGWSGCLHCRDVFARNADFGQDTPAGEIDTRSLIDIGLRELECVLDHLALALAFSVQDHFNDVDAKRDVRIIEHAKPCQGPA